MTPLPHPHAPAAPGPDHCGQYEADEWFPDVTPGAIEAGDNEA